jgi:hypothetical protein
MSIVRKILSGFIALSSAYLMWYHFDAPEAKAWLIAMTGWAIIFLDDF